MALFFHSFIYVRCVLLFLFCTFCLSCYFQGLHIYSGNRFCLQSESCPTSFSHPHKCTSGTERSLLSSEQAERLLVACDLFHIIELLSLVCSEQQLLLTCLQVSLVLVCFRFNPNGDNLYQIHTYDLQTNAKLLGSLLFSKTHTCLFLYSFPLFLIL